MGFAEGPACIQYFAEDLILPPPYHQNNECGYFPINLKATFQKLKNAKAHIPALAEILRNPSEGGFTVERRHLDGPPAPLKARTLPLSHGGSWEECTYCLL
jgi:hypothetical protein